VTTPFDQSVTEGDAPSKPQGSRDAREARWQLRMSFPTRKPRRESPRTRVRADESLRPSGPAQARPFRAYSMLDVWP
jgi:hypothetical protein